MRNLVASTLLPLAFVLQGCSSSEPGTAAAPDAGSTTVVDSGSTTVVDSGTTTVVDSGSTTVVDSGTTTVVDSGSSSSTGATLTGSVKRVATTLPSAGGKGPVYVAVFDSDPVINAATARAVGNALIADADMSSPTASVRYTITNLPPRSQQYFVIAFLDDNKNAPTSAPAPDRGDLISMDGFAAPKVTLSSATTVTLDLSLTMAKPF